MSKGIEGIWQWFQIGVDLSVRHRSAFATGRAGNQCRNGAGRDVFQWRNSKAPAPGVGRQCQVCCQLISGPLLGIPRDFSGFFGKFLSLRRAIWGDEQRRRSSGGHQRPRGKCQTAPTGGRAHAGSSQKSGSDILAILFLVISVTATWMTRWSPSCQFISFWSTIHWLVAVEDFCGFFLHFLTAK